MLVEEINNLLKRLRNRRFHSKNRLIHFQLPRLQRKVLRIDRQTQ
jgi:hypothetical protein